MKKFWIIMTGVGSSVLVYLATLAGIAMAQYAPKLITGEPMSTAFDWMRLAISMMVAFYLVVGQEEGGDEDELARVAKRKHLKRRIANAMAHGLGWSTIIGIAGQAAGQ